MVRQLYTYARSSTNHATLFQRYKVRIRLQRIPGESNLIAYYLNRGRHDISTARAKRIWDNVVWEDPLSTAEQWGNYILKIASVSVR